LIMEKKKMAGEIEGVLGEVQKELYTGGGESRGDVGMMNEPLMGECAGGG